MRVSSSHHGPTAHLCYSPIQNYQVSARQPFHTKYHTQKGNRYQTIKPPPKKVVFFSFSYANFALIDLRLVLLLSPYMLARKAAPPKRAAAPIAAVCLGTPAVAAVPVAAPVAVAPVAVAATPEVNGTFEALEAPLKPGEPAVPVGVAVLLPGLRTL